MNVKIFIVLNTILGLCSFSDHMLIKVPKPKINEVNYEFKAINITKNGDLVCLDDKNFEHIVYNIKMARLYHNQEIQNRKIIEEYYENIIKNFGGEII